MTRTSSPGSPPDRHIVKRHAGSRLHDTETLKYVTVEQLRALSRTDVEVIVHDAAAVLPW
jgi:polyhydroxyalkanoate synthesis regulator protein